MRKDCSNKQLRLLLAFACLTLGSVIPGVAAEPLDLFADVPELGEGAVRIAAWNLRHIDLDPELGTARFLPGASAEEDFAILTATFGKGILDLGLDLVAVIEHQPRANEPNRLQALGDWLNANSPEGWSVEETAIDYDSPTDPYGNLQFGLLWKPAKIELDPAGSRLLLELRQPRNEEGVLKNRSRRVPWLVSLTAGSLAFDLVVVHLKSGGRFPQGLEVDALSDAIRTRQLSPAPRHLVLAGDWNIRPDQEQGRARLRQLAVPGPTGPFMRILSLELVPPSLQAWQRLTTPRTSADVRELLPFTHFNASTPDTLLDHIAISRSLDEVFAHPVEVMLANGRSDLRPGFRIARPLMREEDYVKLTDHLPVVLILPTDTASLPPPYTHPLTIAAALPDPTGRDVEREQVHLKSLSSVATSLAGWRISDAGGRFWQLNAADGVVESGATVIVVRQGRPMYLANSGGTIVLIDPNGRGASTRTYGRVSRGELIRFD